MNKKIIIALALIIMLFSTAAFAQSSQTITLKPGFNFISFSTAVTLTTTQFKALNASIEDAYLFSAAAGSFLSINEGTLTSLSAGKGYIVKNSSGSDITITVPGNLISSIGNITLKTGFNLVGFSKVPTIKMTFSQLMTSYSVIKGIYKWSAAAGSFISVVKDSSGTPIQLDGVDPEFKASESYFLNLTGDTSINYDGTSIVVGASPVDPNAKSAVISGTLNTAPPAMAKLGLNYAVTNEEFDVTLVDFDGNPVPSISLEAGETNPKTVKDGQSYSFKTKDFTKSYKVMAVGKTTTNKMLSTFVGKVKENETVGQRDVTPIATAMSMIYADPLKDAATYKTEEQAKISDSAFMSKLTPIVADLETKRSASLKDANFSTPAKLEEAYKDAILGSNSAQEIAKIKEGLDAIIGKLEEQLSILEKLKDALALVATSGRRQNETFVRESQTKLENILKLETPTDTANQQVFKEAKVSFGLVCKDLGDIFKNKTSSTAAGAPNMMAAYQAMEGELDPLAKAEYEKGYNAVKNLTFNDSDKSKGLDQSAAAAILKTSSELAKEDPAKLDEAKKKADLLLSDLENDGKTQINLPTGESFPKDKILEEKGNALINGGRPTEAVNVFEGVSEPRVKNFGLGRAYLQLNDLEYAYKNLKDSVKDIVKSSNGFESRMNVEAQFGKINEAIFAFAAVLDKLKNSTETDVMQLKNKIKTEEQLEGSAEQILDDPSVTLSKMIRDLKPTTSFFEVGKKFADGQTGFGGQFVDMNLQTDTLKKAFQEASKLMFKANQLIDQARNAKSDSERKLLLYEGKTVAGTLEAPAADTGLKLIKDAEAAFEAIFSNSAVIPVMKGDAHYHLGLAYLSDYRAYKILNIENKELIAKAKEIFLTIRTQIYDAEYTHLSFAITQMIKTLENIENEMAGVVVEDGSIYKNAERMLERAETLYFDGQNTSAAAEFDKAFAEFDKSYKSTDTKITAKMKEAALYYSGYCLFYKLKLMSEVDDASKTKALERLKLFTLKFPNSEFLSAARDMVNDINSAVSLLGPANVNMAKPGPEFEKAMALMDKLRLYYKNNFTTTEIETAFNQAKVIFEEVVIKLTTDVKYIGNFADPKFATGLKAFRAHAKFMLAILYMERFAMPMVKEGNYKNLALQYLNELVTTDYDQPFISDAKRFISQLKEETKMEFSDDQPIITDIFVNNHVLTLEQIKAGTAQFILTAGVVIPDAASGVTVVSVKAELKKFGNTVYDENGVAIKDLAFTKVASSVAGAPEKWELKLTPPKNLEVGPYDFKIVALTSASKSSETYVAMVVEGQSTYARITNVNVKPEGTSHIFTVSASNAPAASFVNEPGKYTDVYVSVMVAQYGSMTPSLDYPQDIKLTKVTAAANDFALDLAKELPKLKQGSYMFLFKLVNFNPADPGMSLTMPVDARPFDFFVQSTVAGADNQIVLNVYNKVLENFNSTKTAAEKVSAFEKMCDSALQANMKTALTTAFTSVNGLKFTVVGTPFVQYEMSYNGESQLGVYAPWKISGTYSKDVFNGVMLPDGKLLLPPGKTGAKIMDFIIEGNFSFAKRFSNGVETWLIAMGDAGMDAPVTSEMPVINSFAGMLVPAGGGQINVPSLTNIAFVKVAGTNLQSYEPDVKRVLRLLGPNLQFPIVLSDSGSYEWMSDSISFSSEKLKGLKGLYNLELLDSKRGPIATLPLSFTNTDAVAAVSAILFQITSGQNSAQPFNLIRPFEIDRTYDLIIKGDMLKPASGTYSLRYYNMMSADGTTVPASMATMFISFAVSTDAGWTTNMITVKKEMLPSSTVLTDGMPTSIVVWDDAKNMPASSQISVVFLSQMIDPNAGAQAVINTVNGYDAKSAVMIDKKSGDTMANIDVIGSGFMSYTSRHLDLVLQINGRPVHIPIAYSAPMTAAGTTTPSSSNWSDGYIKGVINYSMPIPVMDPTMPAGETLGSAVTKYPCGLLIWDDKLQKQVTPFMVSLKFMATTTTMPLITSVNSMAFNGMPIELSSEAPEIKVDGQNFGDQSAIGTKGLFLRSQPTPMNPIPVVTVLDVRKWEPTTILVATPVVPGGIYELFIGDMATSSATYYDPTGVATLSKIVFINIKSSSATTTQSAFISNINGTSTASAVTIAPGVTALNITGKGFKSTYGTSRMLYMKLKGTNDWKYLADSYMATWTDTSINATLFDQPVGAFEMFIAETDFGASIISNIAYVNFGQSTTGPNITSINGFTITPGMMVTLKSDFTSLELMGVNFGANTDNSLIVRFVPFPDPTNPNPAPFNFPTTSWSSTIIKVGRPTLATGVTLMKGNIEIFNKTINKPAAMPVSVDFTSTTASTIPSVSGLKYDSTARKLMWNPATSSTTSMMYAYVINISDINGSMVFEVPMGVYDFPVNTLMDGEHKAAVQARIPNTYPAQVGPLSTAITFTTSGGTVITVPKVEGLMYDSAMMAVKWTPVETVTPEGWMQYYVYMVEIDGSVLPNPMSMAEFFVMNLTSGTHKIRVQAQLPGSFPPVFGPFSDSYTFSVEGGTAMMVPPVTGLVYESAMNKLKWNPIDATSTPMPVAYKVEIDTMIYGPFYMNEFFMPPDVMAGTHTARVHAMFDTMPPQFGDWSAPVTFTSVAGTSTGAPNIMTLEYLDTMKKLVWTTDSTTATMGVSYIVALDNNPPMPMQMMEFFLPPAFPQGTHTAKVWAQVFINNTPIDGTPKMITFTVGSGTTGSLMAPVISYDPATKMLTWAPVAPPDAASIVEYKILVDGIEKMMWAQTSVNVGNTALINDWTVNHVITVKAVVYNLNLTSGPSNAVNTLGGTTTSELMGITAINGEIMANFMTAPVSAPVMADFVVKQSINGAPDANVMPTSIMPYGASFKLMVPVIQSTNVAQSVKVSVSYMGGAIKTATYSIPAGTTGTLGLTFTPMGGAYPNAALNVTITPTPADAKVYFTTNGTAPVPDGTAVSGSKTVSVPAGMQAFVIKAIAHLNGQNSTLYEQSFSTLGTTTLPQLTFAPVSATPGTLFNGTAPLNVTITAPATLTGVTIKYTMDGVTDPLTPNALTYAVAGIPLNIAGTYTIKAVAVDSTGAAKSAVAVMTYVLTAGSTTPPTITGLGYDSVNNKLTWTKPSETAYYYYTVEIDNGMTFEAYSMNEFMLSDVTPALTTGTHTFRVAAKEMGTSTVLGQWSNSFTFNVGGGTTSTFTVPSASNGSINVVINPAPTATMPTIGDFDVKYSINNGADTPAGSVTTITGAMGQSNFTLSVPMIPGGTAVQPAVYKVTYKGITAQSPSFNVPVSGTTTIPNVIGISYDQTMKKLTWTELTPASTYYYDVKIDETINEPFGYMAEYWMPYNIVPGNHTVSIRGRNQAGATGNWSTPITITIPVPPVMGIWYDSMAKVLKWGSTANEGPVYSYNLKIDGGTSVSVGTLKEYSVANLTAGVHKAQVQAVYTAVTPPMEGPWYDPNMTMPEYEFTVQANLTAPGPVTNLTYSASMISFTPPAGLTGTVGTDYTYVVEIADYNNPTTNSYYNQVVTDNPVNINNLGVGSWLMAGAQLNITVSVMLQPHGAMLKGTPTTISQINYSTAAPKLTGSK